MELQIGMPVAKGKPIGYLHSELAELNVAKAKVAAKSLGPMAKALAQKELAVSVVATNERLNQRIKGGVSYEEKLKAEAEVKVADAAIHRGGREARARQGRARPGRAGARGAHHPRPVRRRRHRAAQGARRERPCQRGGRPARQPRQAPRLGLPPARIRLPRQGRADRRAPAQAQRHEGRADPDRAEAVPGQDHVRRPPDPAGRRDRPADLRRVRQQGLRAPPRPQGRDDDLPELRRRLGRIHHDPGRRLASGGRDRALSGPG